MKKVKRRTFSGHVCEQEIYYVADTAASAGKALRDRAPRLRFKSEEERAAHREGIARRAHTRAFNANFGPTSLYSTPTFDDAHEVYDFRDAKRVLRNYIRRLQRRYPEAVIFAYLGRGENTERIHAHMVTEGIPEEALGGLWGQGEVRKIQNLHESCVRRSDGSEIGRDYSQLANYLYNHWTPEQGGHRYYKSRTAKKVEDPGERDVRECKRSYSKEHPPAAPKAPEGYAYFLTDIISTPYGYMNFRYSLIRVLTPTGRPRRFDPPRVTERGNEGANL